MNSPIKLLDNTQSGLPLRGFLSGNVVSIGQHADWVREKLTLSSSNALLSDYRLNTPGKDSKVLDYLLIAALSLFVHSTVVEQFKRMDLAKQDLQEPVKPPPKVQISFVQPKPKPIVQPPKPVEQPPPPKPHVVPIKKPPKPKVQPKPAPPRADVPRPVKTPVTQEVYDAPAEPVISAPPPPPPKPVPTPAPKPKVEEKITQPHGAAGYKNNPPPDYPEMAQDRGWEGRVMLKVHVSPSGEPSSVQVAKSSGHDVLDEEAIRTVKQWEFAPAKRGDTPIDGYVTVPITFNLQN